MNTEIYIENYLLDQTSDLSSLLTFMLDDIKDFSTRTTSFSKTIILPGTSNNNKLLGNIFEFGQSNDYDPTLPNVGYNFNAAKGAACVIFQDNMQTFQGELRLLEIDIIKGRNEYQVAVFGNISTLNYAIGSALLENLDFSVYNHLYSDANIVASWDNPPGSGYYYPLMDMGTYSTDKHNWDYHTFRPALYVKEYIDKIFTAAGFRYNSDLFNSPRFKSLVIPYAQKILTSNISALLDAGTTMDVTVIDYSGGAAAEFKFDNIFTSIFTPVGTPATEFIYNGSDPINITVTFSIYYSWKCTNNNITLSLRKNHVDIPSSYQVAGNTGGMLVTSGLWQKSVNISLVNGDEIDFFAIVSDSSFGHQYTLQFHPTSTVHIESASNVPVPLNFGGTVLMNDTIPKNIQQIDFLVSIVKLFNFYVTEDKFDSRLINLIPYVDFYGTDSTKAIDWTYKLNRQATIKVVPMSEITSKVYNFKYTSDTDYYNDLYNKRYNQNYGDYIFNAGFDFSTDSNDLEIIFSSTPLVGYAGEDKIYGTIFKLTDTTEETTDSNIRIMQTKKVNCTSWNIMNGTMVVSTHSTYGYAGHFDDPDNPTNDLNFGALQEIFFTLVTGFLSNTQFNLYWSSYMAEITDKNSKLVTANFYLKPADIFNLDFSRLVHLDGVLFRLSSITDYNASKPQDTACSLLKVNYLIY